MNIILQNYKNLIENIIKEIFNKNMNIYSFKPIKQSIINIRRKNIC